MIYDIDPKTYAKLYAKYLHNDRTREMVNLAGNLKGKKVLDLCCGGCRLSREVLKQKPAFVSAVDESYTMLGPIVSYRKSSEEPLNKICLRVETALSSVGSGTFNAVFCQQGINYWFLPEHAKQIKRILAPKGMFIFNTFNSTPSTLPYIKRYSFGRPGRQKYFAEVSWMVKDMVKHVQIAEGMDPHFTEFRWITEGEFKKAFKRAGLHVEVKTDKNTDIYVCRKL